MEEQEEIELDEYKKLVEENIEKVNPTLDAAKKKELVEAFYSLMTKGKPLGDSLGFDSNAKEFLYSFGLTLFNTRKYEDATKVFRLLFTLDGTDFRSVMGLAASYQLLGQFSDAMAWYFTAITLDPESPLPCFYISDCFKKTDQIELAIFFLQEAAKLSEGKPEHAALQQRSIVLAKALEVEIDRNKKSKKKKELIS